jgi:hypothetical protein
MFFTVVPSGRSLHSTAPAAFLITDDWDDWFEFSTLFTLVLFDEHGTRHTIGGVKIGQFGMARDQRRPKLPSTFNALEESFFSLGQDETYYEALNSAGHDVRDRVLAGLRDIASDAALLDKALEERVTQVSLLRFVSLVTVRGQFRRLARGDARLTPYDFEYAEYTKPRSPKKPAPLVLDFHVRPESEPPTNIHVIIGRNGVGKTRILRRMYRALTAATPSARAKFGKFGPLNSPAATKDLFASLVFVTFSAFDPFGAVKIRKNATVGVRTAYVGLQRPRMRGRKAQPPKSPDKLADDFVRSVQGCSIGAKLTRWGRALSTLESDPLFAEARVRELADTQPPRLPEKAAALFGKLSSGHKIVLLTVTRLVEEVEEKTLVLMDEPEAHLHPPLLSAFVRALSDLLTQRNGVAIVVTHSPVVLQEVPRSCVWKLRRSGSESRAERPDIETFGENLGVLTREAFGLELTHSGFHKLLQEVVDRGETFDSIRDHFGESLSAEARALLRAMITIRDNGHDAI